MTNKIDKYINEIRLEKICNDTTNYEEKEIFSFLGNGEGDWIEIAKETTKECLENYIKYCQEQIELAKRYLKENIKEN